jgi:hypothetical protein
MKLQFELTNEPRELHLVAALMMLPFESLTTIDMGMSNNDDLTLAQASFQLSPQA